MREGYTSALHQHHWEDASIDSFNILKKGK